MVVMKIKGFQKKIMKNDPFDVIFVFQFLPHLVMASYDKTRKNILSLRKMYFSESSQGDLRKYYSYSQFFIENIFSDWPLLFLCISSRQIHNSSRWFELTIQTCSSLCLPVKKHCEETLVRCFMQGFIRRIRQWPNN